MRRNNKNISLFWYGFFAKLKALFGLAIILSGFVGWIYFESVWVFIVAFIVGMIFVFKGGSQRFDYQRQSGHIMHGGDGW